MVRSGHLFGRGRFDFGGHEPVDAGLGDFVGAEDEGPRARREWAGDEAGRSNLASDEEGAPGAAAPAAKAAGERLGAARVEDADIDGARVVGPGRVPVVGDVDASAAGRDFEGEVEVWVRGGLSGRDVAGEVSGRAHGDQV